MFTDIDYTPEIMDKSRTNADEYCIFELSDHTSLSHVLDKPFSHFIEKGKNVHLHKAMDIIQKEKPDVCLSLTSQTAFKQPVSEYLARYLDQRLMLGQSMYDNFKTCLQEALTNAVIHGNLNIHPVSGSTQDFQDYYETILNHLHHPELGACRVTILVWHDEDSITLCVADEGKGFHLHQQVPTDPALPFGRGLPLIRAMSHQMWQTVPHHLFMKFVW